MVIFPFLGRFPFDEKFWFELPEISRDEWNSIFWNFRKRGQPREVYPNFRKFLTGNFCFIWFSSRNFRNFRLNGSLFRNSTISGFSGNFSQEISVPFVTVSNFLEFLVENGGGMQINLFLLWTWFLGEFCCYSWLQVHVCFYLRVYITQADKKALEILTYLGLTLSLIGISLTILGYVFLT